MTTKTAANLIAEAKTRIEIHSPSAVAAELESRDVLLIDLRDTEGGRLASLDYATWRAHIAAPGSRFEPAKPASSRIARLDAVSRAAVSSEAERRSA